MPVDPFECGGTSVGACGSSTDSLCGLSDGSCDQYQPERGQERGESKSVVHLCYESLPADVRE